MNGSRAIRLGLLVLLGAILLGVLEPPTPAAEETESQDAREAAALGRPVRVAWSSSFEWNDDSAQREHWTLAQQLRVGVTRSGRLLVRQERSMFRKRGIAPVSDDAIGLGWQQALGRVHLIQGETLTHLFSSPAQTLWSWCVKARSSWSPQIWTTLEAGRKPADTAQALGAGISTDFLDATGRWELPSGWSGQLRGGFEWMSDDNHYTATELEVGRRVPKIDRLRAVYIWTTENAAERRDDYYTPNRVRQHKVGGDLSLAGPSWWLLARYLVGFGEELGVRNEDVHTVYLTFSAPILGPLTLEPAFARSKSPTYRSTTYRVLAHCEF